MYLCIYISISVSIYIYIYIYMYIYIYTRDARTSKPHTPTSSETLNPESLNL